MASTIVDRPDSLTTEQLAVVKATAPVVAQHALEITKTFYPIMFKRNPEALAFFNIQNQREGRQPQALANAVASYGANIDNLDALGIPVDEMAVKHCGLNVLPEHYSIVEENLMLAIAKVLGDAVTPEIANAWGDAVKMLSKILITREEQLYAAAEAAPGGWRGWVPFTVSAKTPLAEGVTLYRFEHPKGESIAFVPGQFLTVRCPLGTGNPRHYTIVSEPNQPFLEIAVRSVHAKTAGEPDGLVSSWLATAIHVGDAVDISPPFGLFSLTQTLQKGRDVLFVSAGIGITPIRAMRQLLATNFLVKHASVHQDKSAATHAFKDYTDFARYSKEDSPFAPAGHLDANDLAKAMREADLTVANTVIVCCGPVSFMDLISAMTEKLGVAGIMCEVFGPQLARPELRLVDTT